MPAETHEETIGRKIGDLRAAGKALREKAPRSSHNLWIPTPDRDPMSLLEHSNKGRMSDLLPIRYGRMARSPFAFYRGTALLMAYDLSHTPQTGVHIQACGDCHALNFGIFATPERDMVFDINDFDETHPAPWEWDVKRLAVSAVLAARENGHGNATARSLAIGCVQSYRQRLAEFSLMSPLEIWYYRLDQATLLDAAPDEDARKRRRALFKKASENTIDTLFPKIVTSTEQTHRIKDAPPLLFHPVDSEADRCIRKALEEYRTSLPDERRALFDQYRLEDVAQKVVGVGSVGTRCYVALFFDDCNHPLILQFKEASRSVLEPYTKKSAYKNHGQRVVVGQRLMQSTSDIFLGWLFSQRQRHFYVRQLRDMKLSIPLADAPADQLMNYMGTCGWALARAHAKSGEAAVISGYLGESDRFAAAIADFAVLYADQTERDHARLVAEIKAGRIAASNE